MKRSTAALPQEVDVLARDLFETRRQLRSAGRTLHDVTGSLLSSAGLRLQLLRMDLPEAAGAVRETLGLLDQALESLRHLSRELNSSPPAHLGLEAALDQLVDGVPSSFQGRIQYSYRATAKLSSDAAVAAYEAVAAVLRDAFSSPRVASISISVTGAKNLAVRIAVPGWKWNRSAAEAQLRRALPAGILLDCSTKQGTIVSIHAARRAARG